MTMNRSLLHRLLAIVAATGTAALAVAQDPAAEAPPMASAWPKLSATDVDRVVALVTQFKKEDVQLHTDATAKLLQLGAGAAPFLMQRVHDKEPNQNPQIFAVLDGMVGSEHAELLAKELKKPSVELRGYLTQRLCRFGDPRLRKSLEGLRKDANERIAFHAALGCLALGDAAALDQVVAYSKTHWADEVGIVSEVLSKVRSAAAGNEVFAAIAKQKPVDQMATLRIARYLAIPDHQVIVKTYLASADHTVKKEAVNVCRVLAGEPPLEKLDVFQTIKHANEWLQKLGGKP